MIGVIWMIVNLHFNWLPENALNKAYQVWLPDININFLDIWIDTTATTKERKKVRRRKEIKTHASAWWKEGSHLQPVRLLKHQCC